MPTQSQPHQDPEGNLDLGPQVASDDLVTSRYRLMQSRYRTLVLKVPYGPWSPGESLVGSSLVNGEQTGHNFISPAAFAYAKQRVADKQTEPDLTIGEHRLFNNMLSSMPMAFNLFSDLRAGLSADQAAVTKTIAAMFPGTPIAQVENIIVEMVPTPIQDYIDDKTGFDAAVLFVDQTGAKGLLSIETKYSDKLGGNKAARQQVKIDLARKAKVFTQAGFDHVKSKGFDQINRNLMLTIAYARRQGLTWAMNVVVAPAADQKTVERIAALQAMLNPGYRDWIGFRSLEEVVASGKAAASGNVREVLAQFEQRYLDGEVD